MAHCHPPRGSRPRDRPFGRRFIIAVPRGVPSNRRAMCPHRRSRRISCDGDDSRAGLARALAGRGALGVPPAREAFGSGSVRAMRSTLAALPCLLLACATALAQTDPASEPGETCTMARMRRQGDVCVWCAGPEFRGCHPQPEVPGARSCIGSADDRTFMILCTPEGGSGATPAGAAPQAGCACDVPGERARARAPLAAILVAPLLALWHRRRARGRSGTRA